MDHVLAVFAFGCETLEKMKGWETKTMLRLCRVKRQKKHRSLTMLERGIWPGRYGYRYSMWRAMGSACDEKSHAVINTFKKVYRCRSTVWWHSWQTELMECVYEEPFKMQAQVRWHNRGNVWDKIATEWAGEEDWMRSRKR